MEITAYLLTVFIPALWGKLVALVVAPLLHPEMFWIIFPLVFSVVLMELYFSRYPREEKGYHMALENTIFLLFVAVDLVRYIFTAHTSNTLVKGTLVALIVLYALPLSILDFLHKLPRNIAFKVSSKSIVSFTAYISIVVVYSDVLLELDALSIITLVISIMMLFVLYSMMLRFIHIFQPQEKDEVDELIQNVEKELRLAAQEIKHKIPEETKVKKRR